MILGWYGFGNLGDELILDCILRGVKSACPKVEFVVLSNDPMETHAKHGVRSLSKGGGRISRLRRMWEMADASLFILGGGQLLKQQGSNTLSFLAWLGPVELAHELGVKTMTYAVGVSGQWSRLSQRAMLRILTNTDVVTVRDNASLVNLRQLAISKGILTADPAILLADLHAKARERSLGGRPTVSVFLRHWFVENEYTKDEPRWNDFKSSLASSLDSLVARHSISLRFVPMRTSTPDDDSEVAREVTQLMRYKGQVECLDRDITPSEMLTIVAESDLVVGMRLHSLIVAASLGVPAIAVNYESKVKAFASSVGADDWIVEVDGSGATAIKDLAENVLIGLYPEARVSEKVGELKELARANAAVAARLLQESDTARSRRVLRVVKVLLTRLFRRKKA